MKNRLLIVAAAIALVTIALIAGWQPLLRLIPVNTGGIPVPATSKLPRGAIPALAEALRENLKDPYSAVYSEVDEGYEAGRYGVCGLVNAKNGYGAFAGDSFFNISLANADGEWRAVSVKIGEAGELAVLQDSTASFDTPCKGYEVPPN